MCECHETFWTLFTDAAHWQFEAFVMLILDVGILGFAWPLLRCHWKHHVERDRREGVK